MGAQQRCIPAHKRAHPPHRRWTSAKSPSCGGPTERCRSWAAAPGAGRACLCGLGGRQAQPRAQPRAPRSARGWSRRARSHRLRAPLCCQPNPGAPAVSLQRPRVQGVVPRRDMCRQGARGGALARRPGRVCGRSGAPPRSAARAHRGGEAGGAFRLLLAGRVCAACCGSTRPPLQSISTPPLPSQLYGVVLSGTRGWIITEYCAGR